jgi:AraC-like DNA-binding protein
LFYHKVKLHITFLKTNLKLYIKYMVSIRCKMLVKAELEKLGVKHFVVSLGEVDLMETITEEQKEKLRIALQRSGLQMMEDKKAILIEKIKNVIIEMIHYSDELPKLKNSVYLSDKLGHDYTYLSNIFSEVTGTTIEHYIIIHKIEKAKELLLYDEMNLTQISYVLKYSSVAHLSAQFKKITGLTPSFFKNLKKKKRNTLEDI